MPDWILFLDDERFPVENGMEIVICRNSREALDLMRERGCPIEMWLDHDLGPGDDASKIFYNGFEDLVLDGIIQIPDGFRHAVHSQNSVGGPVLSGKIDGLVREMRRSR
ncbi:cyclic-phosphate processing receiver domain-containing protein [Paracoccus litorisediminis]|uniref:cyclic-phosphate processing receiver domain-containing protein n=1 Tax=Paracoccus litorisediminis TaxID=2006130 RepID=UPI00372F33A2